MLKDRHMSITEEDLFNCNQICHWCLFYNFSN